LVDNCKSDPSEVYERELNSEIDYWLPVIAGVATHEQVEKMTAKQLGIANAAARLKIQLFGKGVDG
jgi:hypothetical protein